MGAWGGGLYDSDFALDLKATIKGLMRAPLGEDDFLAEIEAHVGACVEGADALDYWLVLADQLERHGMARGDISDRAIAIVETGEDVALLEQLGAEPRTIGERRKDTVKLVGRLHRPRPPKPRRPLKKPQPLLLQPGDALAWPTERGDSINPYIADDAPWKPDFTPDGWGFGIVTDAGHRFHVLAFYAVQVLKWRRRERPSPELAIHCPRAPHHYGTMGKVHLRRTRVERLGPVPEAAIGPPAAPDYAARMSRKVAVGDIGLSGAFGYDAWNRWVLPGPKFVFPPPSGTPLDPDEPDQRPGPDDQR
jgi:hypothetical protein